MATSSPRRQKADRVLGFLLVQSKAMLEDDLAAALGISRYATRRALRDLQREGLVRHRAEPHPEGKGGTVRLYSAAV